MLSTQPGYRHSRIRGASLHGFRGHPYQITIALWLYLIWSLLIPTYTLIYSRAIIRVLFISRFKCMNHNQVLSQDRCVDRSRVDKLQMNSGLPMISKWPTWAKRTSWTALLINWCNIWIDWHRIQQPAKEFCAEAKQGEETSSNPVALTVNKGTQWLGV